MSASAIALSLVATLALTDGYGAQTSAIVSAGVTRTGYVGLGATSASHEVLHLQLPTFRLAQSEAAQDLFAKPSVPRLAPVKKKPQAVEAAQRTIDLPTATQVDAVETATPQGWSKVSISAPTIVVRNQEMNPSGVPWVGASARPSLDTVLSVIRRGSTQYWLNSRGNGNYALFSGTPSHPFKRMLTVKPTFEAFNEAPPMATPDGTRAKYWIVNTYQDGDLTLAFVHVEHTDLIRKNTGRGRIGLAVSRDYGQSFSYIGDIISPERDVPFNVQGAPYIVKDGYFYVYAKEICTPSDANGIGGVTIVARALVQEVIAAARAERVTQWRKYHNGQWESAGLGGSCTGISIRPEGINHTDAAFSTFTKTYFMALSMNTGHGRRDTWINLYESRDGVNWSLVRTIVDEPPQSRALGYQYVTIVNADGSDNAIVGRKFFIFSGGETPDSGPQGVVYRWTVEIEP